MKMSPRVYAKTKSRSTMKGDWYEVKVAALLYLRSSKHAGHFQLATNVEGAGTLDDIVHRWRSATGDDEATPTTWHTTLVQLKHKERSMLRLGSFTGTRGDFALKRYLTSYAEIKKANRDGVYDRGSLLGGDISNFRLVIYTNARAEKTIVRRKIGSGSTGSERSIVEELLRSNTDEELIFQFDKEVDEEVFTSLEAEDEEDDEEAKTTTAEFFDKLTVFSGQPTESALDDVIKKELAIACGGAAVSDADAIYRIFEGLFKRWWRDSDHVLDENSDIVKRAVDQLGAETELTRQTLRCTLALGFDERTWDGFNTGFGEGVALVHVVTAETSLKLSATKVLCLLYAEKHSFMFTGLDYLLQHQNESIPDWRDGYKDCLVVVSDGFSEGTNHETLVTLSKRLKDILDGNSNKKAIVVSRRDCQLATQLKEEINHKVFEDEFDLVDLDQSTRDKIFGTEVTFQGHRLAWKCLYDVDVDFWRSLCHSDGLMERLVTGRPISIGARLPCVVKHFIERRLMRYSAVDGEFLKVIAGSREFAVVGVQEMTAPAPGSSSTSNSHVVYTTRPADKYAEMCRDHSNVHRLHSDGEVLHWVQSKGDVATVKRYVDRSRRTVVQAESVMAAAERVVLMIAEPGMGKTTLMSTLAQAAKKANPAQWVVHVNLRDHSELFNRSPQLDAVDFLVRASGVDSALEETFLRTSLERTGNIVVLFDSFDEICPRYEPEARGLLTSLLEETRVGKAVVMSRHCMQQVLERHLSTLAYNMVEFTEDDQRTFFRRFWTTTTTPTTTPTTPERLETFIDQLMEAVHVIDPARRLMQVPLQTMMLAEVFQDAATDPENDDLPGKLDMLNLFEQFVDKKFDIFFRKGFINLSRNESRLSFLENHKHAALMLFVPEDDVRTLISDRNIVADAEMFLKNIEGAKYNSGLVIDVVNGKPVFLHQMFAEYFAGMWFTEQYRNNGEFLASFLFHPNNVVVRVMFDRVLAKGHALHEAILDGDLDLVETLATSDDVVVVVDAGGRTPLHLAAAVPDHAATTRVDSSYRVNERFVGPRRRHAVQLLAGTARNNLTDDVFGWTPLRYAARSGSWEAMNHLLVGQPDDDPPLTLSTTLTDENMLEVVLANGYVNVLSLLLKRGLPVNHIMFRKFLLHYAAQYGYLDMVELLLSRGADKRAIDYNGNNPLHVASRFGHLLVVRTLIQNKSRESLSSLLNPKKNKIKWFEKYVNVLNMEKDSALHFAMTADIVRLLVEHGGNLWHRDLVRKTCLHTAAWFGRLSVVDAILTRVRENREDVVKYVNLVDGAGITAVCYACRKGHADITRLLVAHGANVLTRDNTSRTCLHYATGCETALVVIESLGGGDHEDYVNIPDNKGHTALTIACVVGRVELVRCLASHGADVRVIDKKGRTPLHYARDGDMVRALIEVIGDDEETVGKYLETTDHKGNTSLMVAAREGHWEAVRAMAASGANVWTRDVTAGRTCLHVAAENGCLEVAETLLASLDDADVLDYVGVRDANGLTARDVATRPCRMDVYAYYKNARVAFVLWLDEVVEGRTAQSLPEHTDAPR